MHDAVQGWPSGQLRHLSMAIHVLSLVTASAPGFDEGHFKAGCWDAGEGAT